MAGVMVMIAGTMVKFEKNQKTTMLLCFLSRFSDKIFFSMVGHLDVS